MLRTFPSVARFCFLALLIALTIMPCASLAQSAIDGFDPNANGNVQVAVVQPDGKILIGGAFTTLNGGTTTRNRIARLNVDGSVDSSFDPNANLTVEAIALQPDGKVILGGGFTTLNAGAVTRHSIARLNTDGSVDSTFDPNTNGNVYALAVQPDGKILLGGFFNTLNGGAITRNYIARLNSDGSVDTAFNPNADFSVYSIALQSDGKILLGGNFTSLNGGVIARNNIARLNSDGSVDATFNPNADSLVYALAVQPDGKILLGGAFTTLNGGAATRNYIARLNANGSVDSTFDPNADGAVYTIARQADGKILLGGYFTTLNGGSVTRNHIARLNIDASVDSTFNPNADAAVYAVAVQSDGGILMGGQFGTLNGGATARGHMARLNADGSVDTIFNVGANNHIFAIALQPDGKILVGGDFTTLNGGAVARNHIARLNADGSVDTAFNPNPDERILSIVTQSDGKILLGGYFTTLNGGAVARNYIARLNADGSVDTAFNPNANDGVYAVNIQPDGKILLGGTFTTLNGGAITRNLIARLNVDGSVDGTFDPNAAHSAGFPGIEAIVLQPDGKIILGGGFTTLNGGAVTRNHIARLNTDGSVDSTFNPDANYEVTTIALQRDGMILIGGHFSRLNGGAVTRYFMARLNVDGSVDSTFDPNPSSGVIAIAVQPDSKIVIAGVFDSVAGVARNYIARINTDGSVDSTFDPNPDGVVYDIALLPDGKIVLGGGLFTTLNGGTVTRRYLARVSSSGAALQSFDIVGYTAGGSLITWRRSGAGPELALPPQLLSSLDGTAFTLTGTMQRVSGGWRYTDFVPPMAQNFYIRTRGRVNSDGIGSSGLIENTYQLYLNSAEGIFHSGFD